MPLQSQCTHSLTKVLVFTNGLILVHVATTVYNTCAEFQGFRGLIIYIGTCTVPLQYMSLTKVLFSGFQSFHGLIIIMYMYMITCTNMYSHSIHTVYKGTGFQVFKVFMVL